MSAERLLSIALVIDRVERGELCPMCAVRAIEQELERAGVRHATLPPYQLPACHAEVGR